MALCVKCHAEISDGAQFCPFCGASQVAAAPAPAPVPVATPAPAQDAAPANAAYTAPNPAPNNAAYYSTPAPAPVVKNTDHTAEFDAKDISDNKIVAMAAYLLGVIGVVIALLASRDSKYAGFHVRQALKLQICTILVGFFSIVPFIGWLATVVCEVIILVLEIIAFFQVAGGKAKEPAIISSIPLFK